MEDHKSCWWRGHVVPLGRLSPSLCLWTWKTKLEITYRGVIDEINEPTLITESKLSYCCFHACQLWSSMWNRTGAHTLNKYLLLLACFWQHKGKKNNNWICVAVLSSIGQLFERGRSVGTEDVAKFSKKQNRSRFSCCQ